MPDEFLRLHLRHRLGSLQLDVAFALTAPWTVLFGPSGSGKSTILRAIQGLLRPDAATITLYDHALTGAPHRRPVRSAAQRPTLFPHRDVRQNLLWGAASTTALAEVIQLFRLERSIDSPPHRLSGGERQRVAVARAVLSAADAPGSLLLLDEPFNGLDLALRDHLAEGLRDWLARRQVPVLSVTHDVAEAFLLGAEVLRLENGHIVAQGPASQALRGEREQLLRTLAAD